MISHDTVESKIESTTYHRFPKTQLTIAILKLKSGFVVTGESNCVDPQDFNEQVGRDLAYDNAIDKIYTYEAYMKLANSYAHQNNRCPAPGDDLPGVANPPEPAIEPLPGSVG